MGTYGTTEEELKEMQEEMEKELGHELTHNEIEALRSVSE